MRNIYNFLIGIILTLFPIATFADDFFSDIMVDEAEEVARSVEFNGLITLDSQFNITEDSINDIDSVDDNSDTLLSSISGLFTLKYSGNIADLTVTFYGDKQSINLDEAYTNIYFDAFNFEIGYLKTIWGKGDKLHVVDLLNPIDYSSYFTKDYLDNKIAQPTFKFNLQVGNASLFEIAYIPTFNGDIIPTEGIWVPSQVTSTMEEITSTVKVNAEIAYSNKYEETYTNALLTGYNSVEASAAASGAAMAAALEVLENGQDISQYYQDTNSFNYGQAGARFTTSIIGFDLGIIYYFGYEKQPTFDGSIFKYNPINVVGFEFGTVLLGLNLRGEAAYYFIDNSDDTFNYVGGFDRDLMVHNLNLNIQVKGNYNTETEEIQNMLVCKLSDSFNHEKIKPSVTGIINIEDEDFYIKPEVSVKIGENIEIINSAGIFSGDDDTTFGQYDQNDYLAITLKYSF